MAGICLSHPACRALVPGRRAVDHAADRGHPHPLVLSLGPTIGLGAMTVAAVTSLPLSYLYEVGRRTIWAPALIHTAIDSFKLVVIPTGTAATLSLLLIAVSIVVPLLALAVPRCWFRAQRHKRRTRVTSSHA